ncbi:hypothetical protein QBC42DRAFT_264303 [Cladorrhinum samala]|uniref:Uncharacterized protein n=1 Tax=Cladorrhinum samala TaxID=585594 RepID=A0AAV9HVJ3_9PEZI|nr:hypothetical protein QBC42DRAFT_264303 [Cladorrhinum samala]
MTDWEALTSYDAPMYVCACMYVLDLWKILLIPALGALRPQPVLPPAVVPVIYFLFLLPSVDTRGLATRPGPRQRRECVWHSNRQKRIIRGRGAAALPANTALHTRPQMQHRIGRSGPRRRFL